MLETWASRFLSPPNPALTNLLQNSIYTLSLHRDSQYSIIRIDKSSKTTFMSIHWGPVELCFKHTVERHATFKKEIG